MADSWDDPSDDDPKPLKRVEESTQVAPDTSHFFCANCRTGPLMSWERRTAGCAHCEHRLNNKVSNAPTSAEKTQ